MSKSDQDDLVARALVAPAERLALARIALKVRDGEAEPSDARKLLEHFCQYVDQESMPNILLEHLRDSFRSYLDGKQSIEGALGLTKKTGRPNADVGNRQQMAAAVLRQRLQGISHQNALAHVATKFAGNKTIVGEAWKAYKLTAIAIVLQDPDREAGKDPWTTEERARLRRILKVKA